VHESININTVKLYAFFRRIPVVLKSELNVASAALEALRGLRHQAAIRICFASVFFCGSVQKAERGNSYHAS
jgi:hypothetical protein